MTGVYFAYYERRRFRGDNGFSLGEFTTFDRAAAHVNHLKTQPGFANAPDRFSIEFWAFDRCAWESGFAFAEREHGPDIPLWAKRQQPAEGERSRTYAKRLCDARFGRGLYRLGPTSEYAQLKKRIPGSRPGVESNQTLQHAGPSRKALTGVWELSHEHEYRDATGYDSDQTKFLGFFTTREKALDAKQALTAKPGFHETVGGFFCGRSWLDVGQWCEGFISY